MREASAEELSKLVSHPHLKLMLLIHLFFLFRVIIEWSTKGDRGLGSFKNAKMEATTFEDLTLRLGQPYLYQHQGSCEHLMVISDIR